MYDASRQNISPTLYHLEEPGLRVRGHEVHHDATACARPRITSKDGSNETRTTAERRQVGGPRKKTIATKGSQDPKEMTRTPL